ncbi:hypothetical protein [Bradyrhizobium sp. Rc2d]|uniref:hypothetical protein n=1 Tax=Bradyrhizobium sp. Rc2d TaxID=1855321 RepID=UPI00115FC082|nr:hypothetical protein [Bradyrhizobium sp. Rc2d]
MEEIAECPRAVSTRGKGSLLPNIPVCFYSDFLIAPRCDAELEQPLRPLRCKRWTDRRMIAQHGVKPAQRVPIWFEPSQICNRRGSKPRLLPLSMFALESAERLNRHRRTCRSVEQGMTLFHILRGGSN